MQVMAHLQAAWEHRITLPSGREGGAGRGGGAGARGGAGPGSAAVGGGGTALYEALARQLPQRLGLTDGALRCLPQDALRRLAVEKNMQAG